MDSSPSPSGGLTTMQEPPIEKRLQAQKEEYQQKIEEINKTLELLKKNPDMNQLLNSLRRLHI